MRRDGVDGFDFDCVRVQPCTEGLGVSACVLACFPANLAVRVLLLLLLTAVVPPGMSSIVCCCTYTQCCLHSWAVSTAYKAILSTYSCVSYDWT
jgi:hypothetical protein